MTRVEPPIGSLEDLISEVCHAHRKDTYGFPYRRPYSFHLFQVVDYMKVFLRFLGIEETSEEGETLVMACLSHDLFEDTDYDQCEFRERFGQDVYDITCLVTNVPKLEGGLRVPRKVRKERTFRRIATDIRAILVKMADRMANGTFSLQELLISLEKGTQGHYVMYQKEHPLFKSILAPASPQYAALWDAMDKLFREPIPEILTPQKLQELLEGCS